MLRPYIFGALVVGLSLVQNVSAQTVPQTLSEPALEALVTGVALYPDPIVAQILDAAQSPADIHSAITGQASVPADVQASSELPASIVALQEHPDILTNLDQHLQMTASLGAAYRNQPQDVWNAIASVRAQIDRNVATQPTTAITGYPNSVGYVAASGLVTRGLLQPATSTELSSYYGRHAGAIGAAGRATVGHAGTPVDSTRGAIDTRTTAGGAQIDALNTANGQKAYSASVSQAAGVATGARQPSSPYAQVTPQQLSTGHKALAQNWGHLHEQIDRGGR